MGRRLVMSKVAVQSFVSRVSNIIDLYRNNESITIAEMIGAIEIIKLDLYLEQVEEDES